MRIPQTVLGVLYFISGIYFAINSSPHGGTDTHWGFALTGISCLAISAKFLGLPAKRDASTGKTGKPDPFE